MHSNSVNCTPYSHLTTVLILPHLTNHCTFPPYSVQEYSYQSRDHRSRDQADWPGPSPCTLSLRNQRSESLHPHHPLSLLTLSSFHLPSHHLPSLSIHRSIHPSSDTLSLLRLPFFDLLPIMKAASLLATALLVGASSAEVHKLKLNKVPLDDQLVC